MQRVYFISGLGANETAFANLKLPGVESIHLGWMRPEKSESITDYAARMVERITDPNPVIVGLSFGGMMGVEMAKLIPVKKLILVSSAKTRFELPGYFRLAKLLPLHKYLPIEKLGTTNWAMNYIFGAKTWKQKQALKSIVLNTATGFNNWAVDAVINWKNEFIPQNIVHIHGKADHLLPIKYTQPDYTIEDGTHLMILTKAKQISEIMMKELSSIIIS